MPTPRNVASIISRRSPMRLVLQWETVYNRLHIQMLCGSYQSNCQAPPIHSQGVSKPQVPTPKCAKAPLWQHVPLPLKKENIVRLDPPVVVPREA
jgi:hypothetical protein